MKERKINLMVLIIVIVIVLVIGIGIGYLLFDKVVSVQKGLKDEAQGLISTLDNTKTVENNINWNNKSNENIVNSNNKSNENTINSDNKSNANTISSNVVETLKYDVEKAIFANGQSYRVSCNNKLVKNDGEMKRYQTTLYFNDKEIKTLDTTSYMGNSYSSIWSTEDELTLSIIKDYEDDKLEYIIISVNSDTPSGDYKNFYIVNKEGKILGELNWTNAYGINIVGKNEKEYINLETYGFKPREIIIYEPNYAQSYNEKEGLYKNVYTIRNGEMKKETQKVTEVTGVVSAGK